LRASHKLSQEELAFKIGVAQTSVSNFESDKTTPDFLIMHKICETFGVGFEYFLEEKTTNINFKKVENNPNSNIGCNIEAVHNHFPEGILENMLRRIEVLEKRNL
jgi:transcriptional regulator with XRE-family HTH domain